ncbi:MAG: hypothetical protein LC737_10660, partial [Chloroflexi bacterium]|nr:hypothetical protein [Chloroflexota bacterium]
DSVATVAEDVYSLPTVADAYNKINASLAMLFRSGYIPDDETFKRSEFVVEVGSTRVEYERIWSELKH